MTKKGAVLVKLVELVELVELVKLVHGCEVAQLIVVYSPEYRAFAARLTALGAASESGVFRNVLCNQDDRFLQRRRKW